MKNKGLVQFVFFACVMSGLFSCSPFPQPISNLTNFNPSENLNDLLDQFTNSHLDNGSDMKLLIDGNQAEPVFEELIQSAQDHINLEMLNFDNDSAEPENLSSKFINLLADKARQGVLVNVVLDPIIQRIKSTEMIKTLTDAGANVRYYFPPLNQILLSQVLYRTHKKILIADGTRAIVGGMNIGYKYLGPDQWRDTSVLLTGPIVGSVQREFLRDWKDQGGTVDNETRFFPPLSPTGNLSIRSVDNRPAVNDFDLNEMVRIVLRSAKDHVDIVAPYFDPPPWLIEEFRLAADRGTRVRILTNSLQSVDSPSSYYMIAASFESIIHLGVNIYLWNYGKHTLHEKAMVVDDKFAFVGSYNFNYRSIAWDAENCVAFTDPEPIGRIQQMIDNDFNQDFIVPVTQDFINEQSHEDMDLWNFAENFNWLF
ncbi:MAG: phosphatidylserine/phosphatidylglycerophosphate/cardiolipin synthase family protein [Phycisphaerae bacterium]